MNHMEATTLMWGSGWIGGNIVMENKMQTTMSLRFSPSIWLGG